MRIPVFSTELTNLVINIKSLGPTQVISNYLNHQ